MKNFSVSEILERITQRRSFIFGCILFTALLAFEVFNYVTTDFALADLLGSNLKFIGIRWATILAIAFCGIDFAGIARLFTPEQGQDEPAEVWYLFGAWLLAAAMNAGLTWWGVAVAAHSHTAMGSAVIAKETLQNIVPVFIAVMVWVIRILIIGTFSIAGERLFAADNDATYSSHRTTTVPRPVISTPIQPRPAASLPVARPFTRADNDQPAALPFRPSPKPEPSYHPIGMAVKANKEDSLVRR